MPKSGCALRDLKFESSIFYFPAFFFFCAFSELFSGEFSFFTFGRDLSRICWGVFVATILVIIFVVIPLQIPHGFGRILSFRQERAVLVWRSVFARFVMVS